MIFSENKADNCMIGTLLEYRVKLVGRPEKMLGLCTEAAFPDSKLKGGTCHETIIVYIPYYMV